MLEGSNTRCGVGGGCTAAGFAAGAGASGFIAACFAGSGGVGWPSCLAMGSTAANFGFSAGRIFFGGAGGAGGVTAATGFGGSGFTTRGTGRTTIGLSGSSGGSNSILASVDFGGVGLAGGAACAVFTGSLRGRAGGVTAFAGSGFSGSGFAATGLGGGGAGASVFASGDAGSGLTAGSSAIFSALRDTGFISLAVFSPFMISLKSACVTISTGIDSCASENFGALENATSAATSSEVCATPDTTRPGSDNFLRQTCKLTSSPVP